MQNEITNAIHAACNDLENILLGWPNAKPEICRDHLAMIEGMIRVLGIVSVTHATESPEVENATAAAVAAYCKAINSIRRRDEARAATAVACTEGGAA